MLGKHGFPAAESLPALILVTSTSPLPYSTRKPQTASSSPSTVIFAWVITVPICALVGGALVVLARLPGALR